MRKLLCILLVTLSSTQVGAFPIVFEKVMPAKGKVSSSVNAYTLKVELTVLNHLEDSRFGCRDLTVINTPEFRFFKGSRMSLKIRANCDFIKELWIDKEGNQLIIGHVDSNDNATEDSVSIEASEGTEGPSL